MLRLSSNPCRRRKCGPKVGSRTRASRFVYNRQARRQEESKMFFPTEVRKDAQAREAPRRPVGVNSHAKVCAWRAGRGRGRAQALLLSPDGDRHSRWVGPEHGSSNRLVCTRAYSVRKVTPRRRGPSL
ncbi:hypothetical protein NDU88_006655 [Pleurodeles waltl]|uniref:Uncharacterized protein n=1 Tax=Pleurodeles waltl TaxID=8319 RepID=A0AAV7LPT8_PLEWA|nr:hypothetical protein NDU88_006655 [Pleurodeles waltl]